MAKKTNKQLKRTSSLNKTRLIMFCFAFALIGSFIIKTFAVSAAEPPIGLMIQVSSLGPKYTPSDLSGWLNQIKTDHRNKNKPGYINSVVLQDIADKNGVLLTNYLDILAPYLPGGKTPIFDRAYVGTVDLPWTAPGSKYIEGIENADFRNLNVSLSSQAAKEFKTRYPSVKADWYITYEANLSGFWDTNIETAYLTYINQLLAGVSSATQSPVNQVMWSPAFWTMYGDEPSWALPSLKQNLTDLFSKTSKPLSMDVQDFVGQSGGASTKESAASWANYLKLNWAANINSVSLNAEQFKQTSTGIIAGDTAEVASRENYYAQNGIAIGPSWEIRYWHSRVYGTGGL